MQKPPHSLFLKIYYVWFFLRKTLRAEYVRRRACLPLLSTVDLAKYKRSDTLFILGTGPSINQISPERWRVIAQHNSLALNFWFYHSFVPTYYVVESSSYDGPRDTVTRRMLEAANRRAAITATPSRSSLTYTRTDDSGSSTLVLPSEKISTPLTQPYLLAARNQNEFEYGLHFLLKKGSVRSPNQAERPFQIRLQPVTPFYFCLSPALPQGSPLRNRHEHQRPFLR